MPHVLQPEVELESERAVVRNQDEGGTKPDSTLRENAIVSPPKKLFPLVSIRCGDIQERANPARSQWRLKNRSDSLWWIERFVGRTGPSLPM